MDQESFVTKLKENGIPAAVVKSNGDNHEDLNSEIGTTGDQKTELIMKFFQFPHDVELIAQSYGFTIS